MWDKKLENFIQEIIDKNYKKYFKQNQLSQKEKERIKSLLKDLAEIKSANNNEPLLKYHGKFIIPRDHLQDLINQLKEDIWPLLTNTVGGAPFTVLRNVFCYMEYISLLRFGTKGNGESGNLEKLLENFGPEDMKERYLKYRKYLIQIYRHDLVHLTSPRDKIIKVTKSGKDESIEFTFFYIISDVLDKNKKSQLILNSFDSASSLMRSVHFRKDAFVHLRLANSTITINSFSMFFDLVNYIKGYQASLAKEEELNRNFAENFIKATLNSALKLFGERPLDLNENKQI